MANNFKNYRDESRKQWGFSAETGQELNLEQVKAGAILRIADATELMAKDYRRLLGEVEYLRSRCRDLEAETGNLRKSNSALRGQITRLKNQIKGEGSDGTDGSIPK